MEEWGATEVVIFLVATAGIITIGYLVAFLIYFPFMKKMKKEHKTLTYALGFLGSFAHAGNNPQFDEEIGENHPKLDDFFFKLSLLFLLIFVTYAAFKFLFR